MRQVIAEAIRAELAEHDTIIIGEALVSRGGAARTTYGLFEDFGPHRVVETPVSENAIVGMGLGAALAGLRVIVEVYSADFLLCAGSEVINDIAKWRFQHRWEAPIHLVLRMPMGSAGVDAGPEHTQSVEAFFHHAPGLRIVVPGDAATAGPALRACLAVGDPVVFLEHRALYDRVPTHPATIEDDPLAAQVARPGDDVTIVAWGAMRDVALSAAATLADQDGVRAEVLDPVVIKPLDFPAVIRSATRTGHLVVVEESPRTGGVSAEILARCAESETAAGIRAARVTMPDMPHPFDETLEAQVTPAPADVVRAVRAIRQ